MNWQNIHIKIPCPENTAYILPCEKGVAIYYGEEMCVLEGIDVQECVNELEQFDGLLNIKEAIDVIKRKNKRET